MSREFSAMVVAGSAMQLVDAASNVDNETPLVRIGEEDRLEETYPLAIVPDTNPIPSPRRAPPSEAVAAGAAALEEVSVVQVKKEEVESKISAWQTAEVAKVNNRFKLRRSRDQRLGERPGREGHGLPKENKEEVGGTEGEGNREGAERRGAGPVQGRREEGIGRGEEGDEGGEGTGARQFHEGRG